MKRFYSNGKLLLSGEYLILDGATGLALPTALGQVMTVSTTGSKGVLSWASLNENDKIWFEGSLNLSDLNWINFTGEDKVATVLRRILLNAKKENRQFLNKNQGLQVTTRLEFPQNWGLGSSSTLINNIAQWAVIDPFKLLFNSFGGSGYDIACAKTDHPILYNLKKGLPKFEPITFDPIFKEKLFFVHLNKKQVSSDSIKSYKNKIVPETAIKSISKISKELLLVSTIDDFNLLLNKHEFILSEILDMETVQERLFPDFQGQVKSLGAWGGDFVLASGDGPIKDYFNQKGYQTIIPYSSMIKGHE